MLKLMRRNRELEDEVMADVPGWKTGTWYYTVMSRVYALGLIEKFLERLRALELVAEFRTLAEISNTSI